MATLANKPEITIQGNVVVDESGAPTGFYELALCVRSPKRISGPDPANPGSTKEFSEAEYAQLLADIEAGTASVTKDQYTVTYYPFSAASAVVNVNTDVLTAVNWDVAEVKYAAWDGTAYDNYDAAYPRGVDTAASADAEIWGPTDPAAFPDVTQATMDKFGRNPVALDAEGDRSTFTAAAQADYYYEDGATKAAVVTLSAHAPDNKPVVYKTSTPVVVVRFAYDLKRFPKGVVKINQDYNATNPLNQITGASDTTAAEGFWLGLDRGSGNLLNNGKTPITWLADTAMDGAGAAFSFSDALAAQTEDGQVAWTKLSSKDTAGEYVGWDQTEYYYYLGAQPNGSNGTVGTENVYNAATGTFDLVEHIKLPTTQGTKVLGHGTTENPEPVAGTDTWTQAQYSYFTNLLHLNSGVKLKLVNDLTFKKPTGGTGGNIILFYDWDDTLIGSMVVGDGDVRAQVNAYIEKTMVHPDLRVGDVLKNDLGGAVPDYSTTTPGANTPSEKYKNVLDSLDREYTYRGKYPYKLGGSDIQDDPNDLPGSEYPLTNKLDYAFYRHINTTTTQEYTNATGDAVTDRYITAANLSTDQDAAQYPWVYGWAVVEDNSAKNYKEWQVRRDAAKVEDVWTTFGVGELSNLNPSFDLTTPGAQAIPTVAAGGTTTTTYPAFVDATAATAPTDYSYLISDADDASYLRFADFSDIGAEYTRPGQDTLIVKAVYEPGTELLTGFNYRVIQDAHYSKLNGRSADNGGAFSVDLIMERSTYEHADGRLRGVSRVRDPAVRQDTTYDQKWIQNLLLGVDHNLDNATLDTAIGLSETMYTNVEVISGDEVGVTLSLSARQNTVNYFLTEKYGWNFVAGGTRSASTLLPENAPLRLLNNYNYDSTDSDTTDIYYDVTQYADRDGSHGFVLYGTLNYLMEQATQVNRGKLDMADFRTNADFAALRDANLRVDALGTQPETGLGLLDVQDKLVAAAAACEANKSADTWDYINDCAQLSYHQLQLYILNGTLLSRSAADATPISWCHLHKTCADMTSGAPKTWQEIMDAAADPAKQDTIEKMAVADIENLTGLRMNAAGTKYTNLTTFKNQIVAAVTALKAKGMDTTWLNVQYAILNPAAPDSLDEAEAKAHFWWYDSSLTAMPTAKSLADLAAATEDYYTGVTMKDGTTVTGWTVKFNGLEDAYNGNQTPDDSIGAAWLKLTENFVQVWTVNPDDTETTSPFHGGIMPYTDFLPDVLLPVLKKGIDAGELNDPYLWYKMQYCLLHPDAPWPTGITPGDGSPEGTEMARYWWHNGGKLLLITDVKTMLEVALVSDGEGASVWSAFAYQKFADDADFDEMEQLRFQFDGTQPIDATNFDRFKDEIVDFVTNSGETDFDPASNTRLWEYIQYQLIHSDFDSAQAIGEANASYYWWKGGAASGQAVAISDASHLANAGFRSKINGNSAAWDDLTQNKVNNIYFRDPEVAKLDDNSYVAHTDMPELSMAELKTAVETLTVFRMEVLQQADPTGHYHTPPTITWLDVQHYIVTGDKDWTGTLDGTADFADETAAQARYWWYDGGENPVKPAVPVEDTALNSFIETFLMSDADIDKLKYSTVKDITVDGTKYELTFKLGPTTAFSSRNFKDAQKGWLKSFVAAADAAGQDRKTLTWYQIQYALMDTKYGGGAGAYKTPYDAYVWGKDLCTWRPDWVDTYPVPEAP